MWKSLGAPHDHRAEHPDDDERRKVVAPLNAQRGHGLRGQNQHGADAEVGGVPDVTAANAQRIFRCDRERAAQRVGPEGRRAQQNADADAGDVSAGRVRPFVQKDAAQNHLNSDSRRDREQRFRIALENAERKIADQQNQRDEDGRQIRIERLDRGIHPLNCGLAVRIPARRSDCAVGWLMTAPSRVETDRA